MPDIQAQPAKPPHRLRRWIVSAIRMAVTTALFGWFYAWASPICYPRDRVAGPALGCLHGALMPMALPSLLMGQNVDIYTEKNSGRSYKIGYIAGINLCGLVFFGSIFWRPGGKSHDTGGIRAESGA